MSSNYRVEYTREIKYILEHFSELKLTNNEMQALQETLTFVKWQVQEQIVQEIVRGNIDLPNQIEQAQDKLKSRLEELEGENEQQNTSEKDQIKHIVEEMDSVKELIGKPEDVVEHFLKQWEEDSKSDSKYEARYNNLINICATNMAHGYMSMERARSGEDGADLKTGAGIQLFSHDNDKDVFSGYTPNPEAISEFLNLIRDPATVEALEKHGMAFKAVEFQNEKNEKIKAEVSKAELLNRALTQKESLCKDVEEYFLQLAELNRKKEKISAQISALSLPQKTNAFMRFIHSIVGKTKRQQSKLQDLNSQLEKLQGEIDDLVLHENADRIQNSQDYAAIYEAYRETVAYNVISNDKTPVEIELEVATFLNSHEGNMHEYVVDKIKPEERLSKAKEKEQEVALELDKKLQTLSKAYDALTPEAKSMVDKNPNGYISTEGIKSRYVIFDTENMERRYGVSPFVSSLILETLMKLNNIHTVEDAKKFGLTISEKDLTTYTEKAKIIEELIKNNLATLSKDKETKETEQTVEDDGR